ncbi:hypothetical protein [Rufibacter soli]
MPQFRIKKYPKGYVVEVERERGRFFKKKYWEHYIAVSGIDALPWYHSSFEAAMSNLLFEVKRHTLENS